MLEEVICAGSGLFPAELACPEFLTGPLPSMGAKPHGVFLAAVIVSGSKAQEMAAYLFFFVAKSKAGESLLSPASKLEN